MILSSFLAQFFFGREIKYIQSIFADILDLSFFDDQYMDNGFCNLQSMDGKVNGLDNSPTQLYCLYFDLSMAACNRRRPGLGYLECSSFVGINWIFSGTWANT